MANSTVEFQNIDEEFPIAGQDNDSQGFRDNFAIIKEGLQNSSDELTELLTYAARKDQAHDFNGETLQNASLLNISEDAYNTDTLQTDTNIEWTDGLYQNVTIGIEEITLVLGEWPENGKLGKMRLVLRTNSNLQRVVNLQAANTGTIRVSPNWPVGGLKTTANIATPVIIDVWTSDGGSTIFAEYIGEFEPLQ